MSEYSFTPEQELAITNTGGSLLVSAAAGSGKTRVLVERLLRQVLANQCDADNFLVITFTRAAASELRSRILKAISDEIARNPADRRLRRQLTACCRAQIGTIHSYCASILREYAHLVGISPSFRIAEEQEAEVIRTTVLERYLDGEYANKNLQDPFFILADTVTTDINDDRLVRVFLDTHEKLFSHPDPIAWVTQQKAQLEIGGVADLSETIWGQVLMESYRKKAAYLLKRLHAVISEGEKEPVFYKGYGTSLMDLLSWAKRFTEALCGKWDDVYPIAMNPSKNSGRASDDYKSLKDAQKAIREQFENLSNPFRALSKEYLSDMAHAVPAMKSLLDQTLKFNERYSAEKRSRGVLDYNDLEHFARRLLVDPVSGEPTDAAKSISLRYREVMVDEYQDVNRLQDDIFRAVSRDGNNLFFVGDVKQSIYRFRLADPSVFLKRSEFSLPAAEAGPGEPRKVFLSTNFRSGPGVIAAVNHVFHGILSKEVGELEYSQEEELRYGGLAKDSGRDSVEFDLLKDFDDQQEVLHLIQRIRSLHENGSIHDANGTRPVRYGDIAVLMRSVGEKGARYASALEAAGIPCSAGRKEAFYTSEEISITLNLLSVIDNPHDDVALASVMLSPIGRFTPSELAILRAGNLDTDLYGSLLSDHSGSEHTADLLALLSRFRDFEPDLASHELIWQLYAETGLLSIYGSFTHGSQKKARLMTLYETARSYEDAGYKGLYRFLTYVRAQIAHGKEPDQPADASSDCVQLMSIHKSKGLEFPIVILANTGQSFNKKDMDQPMLIHPELGAGPIYIDTERRLEKQTIANFAVRAKMLREEYSEEARLLYVAMTRAKEKLILFVRCSRSEATINRLSALVSWPIEPEVLLEQDSFSDWLILTAMCRPEGSVLCPDHSAEFAPADGYPWKICCFESEETEPFDPVKESPAATDDGIKASEIIKRLEFKYPYAPAVTIPSKLTATELKGRWPEAEAADDAFNLQKENGPTELRTPNFIPRRALTPAQKGTAQHLAMQHLDFSCCQDEQQVTNEITRMKSAGILTQQQADAVRVRPIVAFFQSDLGKRVLRSDRIRREQKFSLLVPSKTFFPQGGNEKLLLQGVVDLCFEENGKLVLIDFKTDHVAAEEVTTRAKFYSGQMKVYAEAMERIFMLPVSEKYLWFFSCSKEAKAESDFA